MIFNDEHDERFPGSIIFTSMVQKSFASMNEKSRVTQLPASEGVMILWKPKGMENVMHPPTSKRFSLARCHDQTRHIKSTLNHGNLSPFQAQCFLLKLAISRSSMWRKCTSGHKNLQNNMSKRKWSQRWIMSLQRNARLIMS